MLTADKSSPKLIHLSARVRADVAARRAVHVLHKANTERLLRATVGRLTALPPWAFDAAREPV